MSVLNFPTRRTVQPQGAARIAWGNSLTAGLIFASIPGIGGAKPVDIVGERQAVTVGGTPAAIVPGQEGWSQGWTTTQSDYYERDTALEPANVTWGCFMRRTGTVGSYAHPFGKTYNNGGSTPFASWTLEFNNAGSGQDVITTFGTDGSTIGRTTNYTHADTTVPFLALGDFDGSQIRLWVDGVFRVFNVGFSGTIGYDTTSTGRLILSGNSSASVVEPWNGDIYLAVAWNRLLAAEEHQALAANPWQLFAPMPSRLWQAANAPFLLAQACL